MLCARCGTVNREDVAFCVYCGATLTGTSEPIAPPAATPRPSVSSAIHPIPPSVRERRPDFVGLIGVAFFLLIVGVVFLLNTNLLTELRGWWDRILERGLFARPPEGIIATSILFFALVGLSNFLTAGLRWMLDRSRFGALARVLAGTGFLVLALLLTRYATLAITGALLISAWSAVLGTLLVIYIAIGMYWVRARRPALSGAEAPTTRP